MSFNLQPVLENNLILLRPLTIEDYGPLYKAANDPLIWQQHPNKRNEQHEFDSFFKDALASKGALVVIDKISNKIIGSSRYEPIETATNAIEIGWSFLAKKYWGGKYNQAVKQLMIDYAFKDIENIVFYIDKNNLRSQKAIEKINGKRIFGDTYKHLVKKNDLDFTYVITKNTR